MYGCREVAEILVRRGAAVTLEFAAGLSRIDLLSNFFDLNGRLLPNAGPHTSSINNAISPLQPISELMEQALIYAVINDRIESAVYLLDRGADINAMPSGFHFLGTPLHWAAGGGSLSMVELLLHRGADMYVAAPKDKATPLDMAEGKNWDEIVHLLKKLGATR